MLYLANDHRGLKLKNQLVVWLRQNKIAFKDLGAYSFDKDDDFPDFAKLLAEKVLENPENKGVAFCGSGAGMSIACNKQKGIRAAIGYKHQQVTSFVEDDNVNVLVLAADHTTKFKCFQLVKKFLNAKFIASEKHLRRLGKIEG